MRSYRHPTWRMRLTAALAVVAMCIAGVPIMILMWPALPQILGTN